MISGIGQGVKTSLMSVKEPDMSVWEVREAFVQDSSFTSLGDNNAIHLQHNFDQDGCYCFQLEAEGYSRLYTTPDRFTSQRNCTPHVEGGNTYHTPEAHTTSWMAVAGVVGVLIVVLTSLLLLVLFCRTTLHTLRRYDTENLVELVKVQDTGVQARCVPELLLLYADDVLQHQQLQQLKKMLQKYFKVQDIYDNEDTERLYDINGWLSKKLLGIGRDVGVKVVLVMSSALISLTHLLQSSNSETRRMSKLETQQQHLQLTFALRILINTCLFPDYSRVFIVRLDGCRLEEEEEEMRLVVGSRRYNLPRHLDTLLHDIQ
nr:uncharacterized protein LOC128689939 [Cherax quadricarinatus]